MAVSRRSERSVGRRPGAVKLQLEHLELRTLPSAAPMGVHLPGNSAAARGLECETQLVYDFNNDGAPDRGYGGTYRYNARGQVLEERYSGDYNFDGQLDYTALTKFIYGQGNRLVGQTLTYEDVGGVRYLSTTTFVNDSHGNPLQTLVVFDSGCDGTTDAVIKTVATYNHKNKPLTSLLLCDYGNDGSFEYTRATVSTYDTKGNLLTSQYAGDTNDDGVIDDVGLIVATYDSKGNLLTRRSTADRNNDGTVDSLEELTNSYDAKGHLLTARLIGVDENYGYAYVQNTANTYDAKGHLLASWRGTDSSGDGVADEVFASTYVYDAKGNLLSRRYVDDWNNDGTHDCVAAEAYSVDSKGNRTGVTCSYDLNCDGVIDYQFSEQFTY
jgi:hypothetical protein